MKTDRKQLEAMARTLKQFNETWRTDKDALVADLQSLRVNLASRENDYVSLANATNVLKTDRDALTLKVAELEAMNKRLVDMLWGRRSERRTSSENQMTLNFGVDPEATSEAPIDLPTQEIISAEQAAQTAYDQAKLAELEARRKARRERKKNSEAFPDHLERRIRVLDLTENEKEGLKLLGTKITERLRFEKPKVYVEQIQRHEYVRINAPELGVQSVPPPPSIIEGCKYDFSIISAIIAMKFAFHNPTYRQEGFFGQSGWRPSRSTMNDLINYAVDCIGPLFNQAWHSVQQQRIILGDDTTITVLLREAVTPEQQEVLDARKKNRQKALDAKQSESQKSTSSSGSPQASQSKSGSATSYAWLYSGLDAPPERRVQPPPDESPPGELPPGETQANESPPDFSTPIWEYAPYNIFHWSLTHENIVIDSHLKDFRGTFVGDAAGVNARLAARSQDRIDHQSCNSHARRKFVQAESNDPLLASQMVSLFRQLYAVEYRAVGMASEERLELRRRQAIPIWQRIKDWLDREDVKNVLPKSAIGQAISYLRNQLAALQLYLSDGELPFDNNVSERIIRPLAIGRNNWMFLGSAESAPGRMQLFSIVSSALRHCLPIQEYFEDILLQLSQAAQYRPADLELGSELLLSLLPDRWAALHPQLVQHERLDDRKQIAENRDYYRLKAGLAGKHPYGPANLSTTKAAQITESPAGSQA